MFVVGDDGTLAELDGSGKNVRTLRVEQQLEDVVYHPPSGGLLLVSEKKSELILFDPARARRAALEDQHRGAAGRAAHRGEPGLRGPRLPAGSRPRPGGGIIYLAHQRAPAMVVGIAFDTASGATIDAASGGVAVDTSPATTTSPRSPTSPSIDRLVVIADSEDRLLVLGTGRRGRERGPDPRASSRRGWRSTPPGALWIADDKDKSVLRLHGGPGAAGRRTCSGSAAPARAPRPAAPTEEGRAAELALLILVAHRRALALHRDASRPLARQPLLPRPALARVGRRWRGATSARATTSLTFSRASSRFRRWSRVRWLGHHQPAVAVAAARAEGEQAGPGLRRQAVDPVEVHAQLDLRRHLVHVLAARVRRSAWRGR